MNYSSPGKISGFHFVKKLICRKVSLSQVIELVGTVRSKLVVDYIATKHPERYFEEVAKNPFYDGTVEQHSEAFHFRDYNGSFLKWYVSNITPDLSECQVRNQLNCRFPGIHGSLYQLQRHCLRLLRECDLPKHPCHEYIIQRLRDNIHSRCIQAYRRHNILEDQRVANLKRRQLRDVAQSKSILAQEKCSEVIETWKLKLASNHDYNFTSRRISYRVAPAYFYEEGLRVVTQTLCARRMAATIALDVQLETHARSRDQQRYGGRPFFTV
jgi:hypothetical protein